MKRIWTPPIKRDIDPRVPFDVAYALQCEIMTELNPAKQREMAAFALATLRPASQAFDGMDFDIVTDRAVLPDPGNIEKMIKPPKTVSIMGTFQRFTFLNLSGWNMGIELGLMVEPTVMWPVDRPTQPDYTSAASYPLIVGTHQIRY